MNKMSIHIEMADNGGVVVRACPAYPMSEGEDYQEKTYVYKTLEDAMTELPAMFSVMKETKKTPSDKVAETTKQNKDKDEKFNKSLGGKK